MLFSFFKKYYKSFAIFITILLVSLLPTNNISSGSLFNIPHVDKLAHFLLYMLLSFTIFYDLYKNDVIHASRSFIIVVILISLYGGMIEYIQMFIPGRSGDFTDFLFDFGGSFFGMLFFLLIKERLKTS